MTETTPQHGRHASTDAVGPRLSTSRWTRRGHDRLYVVGPTGETLGYRDLLAGTDHADSLLHRAVVGSIVDGWARETSSTAATPARAGAPDIEKPAAPDQPPAPRTWTDLSKNQPGAAVRAVAEAALQPIGQRQGEGDAVSWLRGAEGEERVGAVLAEVTRAWPVWQALHSVPVGRRGSDIDHVVMGPGGVFTLNTKHHAGARIHVNREGFLVNGASTHHVRNARHEAQRAARLLSAAVGVPLHVTGVVVPVGAGSVAVKEQPEGIFVVPAEQLHRWLRSTGSILPVDVLARVWEAARRSSTWEC